MVGAMVNLTRYPGLEAQEKEKLVLSGAVETMR